MNTSGYRIAPARHPELLAPAGGPEAFAAALAAGADAIYCGMGSFNARRKATNFTDETFAEACRAAHLAGARVYVTVNIVIKDDEMPDALRLVHRCARLGADAFIIQDWGLFFEIRRLMPELETHISTQANIHDARGAAWCRDAGADRVTLSRELSLDEIKTISTQGIDVEVFTHGAICFSYSGLCLLSSFACAGRSANRGMCAQPCRLPYELLDEQGRIIPTPGRERALCPRDNNTIDLLPKTLKAGASALKLEGRMKAPDYVYSVTRAYRDALDEARGEARPTIEDAPTRERRLKRCFNRDFTHAYQLGTSGDEMMSYERSNNRGQIVGEVAGSRKCSGTSGLHPDDKRVRAAMVRLRLHEPVGKGDLLELRHDDEFDQFLTVLSPQDADAGATIEVRAARAMPRGSVVRLIRSQAALDEAKAALSANVARKRAVSVHIVARKGQPFAVELACADDPHVRARAEGFIVEAARTRPVTADDLIEHVGRMGNSPFAAASFSVDMDEQCGMSFSAVHNVRASACEALAHEINRGYDERASQLAAHPLRADLALTSQTALKLADKATPRYAGAIPDIHPDSVPHTPALSAGEVCAVVTSLACASAARKAGAQRIYMHADDLYNARIEPDDLARPDHAAFGIIPILDEVCRESDRSRLDPWVQAEAPVAVGNISELALAAERSAAAELRTCIPVHNLACLRALEAHGARGVWLSPELTLAEIERFVPHAAAAIGMVTIGRARVMASEHCILQVANACIHDCAACRLRTRRLSLRNIDGKILPIRTDLHGRSRLYDGNLFDLTPQIPQLLAAGVTRFAVDGTLMDADEVSRMVARTARAVASSRQGLRPANRLSGATSGCLFVGVE